MSPLIVYAAGLVFRIGVYESVFTALPRCLRLSISLTREIDVAIAYWLYATSVQHSTCRICMNSVSVVFGG